MSKWKNGTANANYPSDLETSKGNNGFTESTSMILTLINNKVLIDYYCWHIYVNNAMIDKKYKYGYVKTEDLRMRNYWVLITTESLLMMVWWIL